MSRLSDTAIALSDSLHARFDQSMHDSNHVLCLVVFRDTQYLGTICADVACGNYDVFIAAMDTPDNVGACYICVPTLIAAIAAFGE